MTSAETAIVVDGRRARRERGRTAVIDAAFELMREGIVPPSAEQVAARAGVSPASVFRYFDGLEDMQRQAFRRFRECFGHLYEIPGRHDSRASRVEAFVEARLRLYAEAGPMLALARARAIEHDPAAAAVASSRELLAAQARRHFAADIAAATPSLATEILALVDSLTSPEAWEIVTRAYGRSRRQAKRLWIRGVAVILDAAQQGSAA